MKTTKSGMFFPDRHEQPPGLHLELELEGASRRDIARGLQAAQEVFRQADVSPYAAAVALAYQESESNGLSKMTDEQFAWADVWRRAEEAAIQSACRDLPAGRKTYLFSVDWDDNPSKTYSADCIRGSIDWPGP